MIQIETRSIYKKHTIHDPGKFRFNQKEAREKLSNFSLSVVIKNNSWGCLNSIKMECCHAWGMCVCVCVHRIFSSTFFVYVLYGNWPWLFVQEIQFSFFSIFKMSFFCGLYSVNFFFREIESKYRLFIQHWTSTTTNSSWKF